MNVFDKTIREKRETLEELLEQKYVMAHLDPRAEHVVIPEHLKESPTLTLQLSLRFRGEMEIERTLIKADLLFSGEYFTCQIPFDAIWALTSEEGEMRLWPEAMPEELKSGNIDLNIKEPDPDQNPRKENKPEKSESEELPIKTKGHLKLVK